MDNPVTEFTLEGQSYFVFEDSKRIENTLNLKTSHTDSQENDFVGELTINKKRYLIAHSEGYRNDNHDNESKKPVDILSRRELQIVMLVAEGRVNKQIANQLNISEWTVSTHLRRIFAKLGVDSRSAMVYRCSNLIRNYFNILNRHDIKV